MNNKSILIFLILFLNIFHSIHSQSSNFRNTINSEKKLDNDDIPEILSLIDELKLYDFNEILDCIDIYYQNVQKKHYRYVASFQEYRDYWKPYSLQWICRNIKNNIN